MEHVLAVSPANGVNPGTGTLHSIYVFFIMAIAGVCIALLFDFFRAVRSATKKGAGRGTPHLLVHLQDFIFLVASFAIFMLAVYVFNGGEIRGYVLLGTAFGIALYYALISPVSNRIIFYICYAVIVVFRTVFVKPIQKIVRFFSRMMEKSRAKARAKAAAAPEP